MIFLGAFAGNVSALVIKMEPNTTKGAPPAPPKGAAALSTGSTTMPLTDKFGNPSGTTYDQEGLPYDSTGAPLTNGNPLPQTEDKRLMYEENGQEFKMPEGHEATLAQFRADIKQLEIAIDGAKRKIETAQAMAAEADESDKVIFDKAINTQQIAMKSNEDKLDATKKAKVEFELSLITPAQRKDERLYLDITEQIAQLMIRKAELDNKRKQYGIAPSETKKEAATAPVKIASDEQKKNYEDLLAKHTTQGAVVIELCKQGKTNAEIAALIGINPANVPGPKNKWLRGEGGKDGWFINEATGRCEKK